MLSGGQDFDPMHYGRRRLYDHIFPESVFAKRQQKNKNCTFRLELKMEMDFLDSLNEPQREGVVNVEGACMIVAGAGSGKTRVLTYRIAYLIHTLGEDPFSILALTFTNKAAGEMRSRIAGIVGSEARNIWMGTFHSTFARMLRQESEKLGYPRNFSIYDTDDSKTLIKQILKERQLDDKLYKPGVVLNRISGAKNRLISWREYMNNPLLRSEDEESLRPEMSTIYQLYCERCFKASAMDFDDLLFNTNVLFRDHPAVLNKYQHRFRHVLVDEFQDTNLSQYVLTRKLSAVHRNICVVGDDAQSIYAFRGADIRNILNFEKDYPELRVIKLEQNYRSTKTIVKAANAVIGNNKSQLKKEVWTANEEGELIELLRATSDNEEGKLVATSIFEEKQLHQLHNSEIAVLYRTNSQSRSIEEALRRANLKYRIIGGLSFYQRREIKDLLAYLRFVLNQNDEQALRRIINLPRRGIGTGSVNKIMVAANENGLSLWDVVSNVFSFMPNRVATLVDQFATMIKSFMAVAMKKDAFETATYIAKQSGLLRELYDDKTLEGLNRYENVQGLLNAIKEFVDDPDNSDKSLGAFLQSVALLTSADDEKDEDKDKITLMTIHMAKGLEFKNVYLVGMEEDLFPAQLMLTSRADLEEERRLFYVAITRAERKLFLSYATSRYRFGRRNDCEPSRFLSEINPAFMKSGKMSSQVFTRPQAPSFDSEPRYSGLQQTQRQQRPGKYKHEVSGDFQPSDTSNLAKGMKVEHPKFGFGKVMEMDDDGIGRKAKVLFDHFGEKTLLLSFAKLKIHD
jgi:DNA helicase-2/ATP-dependent DNA helicase PcrA